MNRTRNIRLTIWYALVMALGLVSCNPTRYISQNESLYTGAELDLNDRFYENLGLKSDLSSVIIPDPNRKFLGIFHMRTWFYHIAGDSVPDKGFKHWLKYKMGEEPVVYKPFLAERSQSNLQYELKTQGYFDARTRFEPETEERHTKVIYEVQAGSHYKIGHITYPDTANQISRMIHESRKNSVLESGEFYNLGALKEERQRISTFLNNNGYYGFIPDYIGFKLDSIQVNATVDLELFLKASMPNKAGKVYHLGKITVLEDKPGDESPSDTIHLETLEYISDNHFLKPHVVERSVLMKESNRFNMNKHNATINKLVGLDVYKYINIDYQEDTMSGKAVLNPVINVTPDVPKSFDLTLEAVTKSNDLSGPGLKINYLDKNFISRAQKLNLELNGGFETQLFTGQKGINSLNLALESSLEIPKLVVPFINADEILADKYRSSTKITLDNSFLRRDRFFTMYSLDAGWAYNWQETAEKMHSFKAFSLDYSDIYRKSEEFKRRYETDPLIRQSYAEQFILSMQYSFTYNNQQTSKKRIKNYFNGQVESSGNLLNLVDSRSGPLNTFLGVYYAQFLRTTLDKRFYYSLRQYGSLAFRAYAGLGYAYGNSRVLPYSRRFFTGGSNSLRGFRYHSIGPGSYRDTSINNVISDQAGDLKLETNLEYRFPIAGALKGAAFIEAGNIWLLRENENKPGGVFKPGKVLNELAVSTGLGVRLDVSIIILRLDVGMPLRNPSFPDGKRWLTTSGNLSSWTWYKNNLILNFALGYPF